MINRGRIRMMKQEPRSMTLGDMFSWLRRKVRGNQLPQNPMLRASAGVATNIHLTNKWHAVAVSCGQTCCRASVLARNTRYLSTEAPPLPLAGCSQPSSCTCKYRHYSDRRAGPRRRTDSDLYRNALSRHVTRKLTFEDRRTSKGRRANDGH
jgi:hypothetical protein